MDKLDVFRIAEPIYRVHTRLFRVQEAVLRSGQQQVRATKLAMLAQATSVSALLLFVLTLFVQIADLKLTSAPVVVLILVLISVVLIYWAEFAGIREAEHEFDALISESEGGDAETWVDYSESVIAAYGARLRMAVDAEEELDQELTKKQISEASHAAKKKHLAVVREYSVERIRHHEKVNQRLFDAKKRSDKEYNEVKRFLETALAPLERE